MTSWAICIALHQSHSAYLTYMQSVSCEITGWMNQSWNQDCQEKYQQSQICR